MLSKLFTTARTLLDRSSQAPGPEPQRADSISDQADQMVTTRRQSGQNAILGSETEHTTQRDVSSSSKKRQISASESEDPESLDDEETGTPSNKKQKVLPVRAKDDIMPKRNTRPVVEIPVRRVTLDHASHINSSPKLPQKNAPTTKGAEEMKNVTSSQTRLEIPDSESEDDVSDIEEVVGKLDTSSTKQTQSRKVAAISASTDAAEALPTPSKTKHKRFDSEESEAMIFSTAVEKEESEDESSDDEAPEVVGAQEALEQAKVKEREATKAVEERESAIRKKRQERDAILKRQASNKRKREGDAGSYSRAKTSLSGRHADTSDEDEDDNEGEVPRAAASTLKLGLGSSLPEFLPEEYLEDDESDDEMALDLVKPTKRAKKTKFAELVEKKPKDVRKGSTTYRVAEARSTKLAPKSSFNARAVKESWLQGRAGSSRKSVSSGFFKTR